MPGKLELDKQDLVLNGAGIREKYFMDMYVCGLYLMNKSKEEKIIKEADEKMAIRLVIVSGLVTNTKMQEAVRVGFEKSTHNNTSFIKNQIEQMITAFSEPIKKGDVYEIFYTPGTGSMIYKNGIQKEVIKGLYFKQSLFGIWLGDNPAHRTLKAEMLGME